MLHYHERLVRKWEESQPWWVVQERREYREPELVGGQHMGWWDQRHLVPTASIRQEAVGAGNTTGGRLLTATRNKGFVPWLS